MLLPTLQRKLASFVRLPLWSQLWFAPVWLLLGAAKLAIVWVPFERLAARLGHGLGPAAWVPLLNPDHERRAQHIGRVVRLAARYTPWDSNCFPQALVARWLLVWHGVPYALCFGLVHDDGPPRTMKAHAWVASGRVGVTGGASFGAFTVVGCFVPPHLLPPSPTALPATPGPRA